MPFFQNPFNTDFAGALVLGDRNLLLNFNVPGNKNNVHDMVCFNTQSYNLSTNNTLTINYSFDSKNYTALAINVASGAVSTSAVKALEVVTALNANNTFATYFTASVTNGNAVRIQVLNQYKETIQRTYISNTSAEIALKFNQYAGVAEIPTYFARHTIANVNNYPDSVGLLVQLDGNVAADLAIIRNSLGNQSWTTGSLLKDWQMYKGRSGLFKFQNNTVDGSNRITQTIEYSAGAPAGDLAKKIIYTYTGANTSPTSVTELPYILASGDLLSPP